MTEATVILPTYNERENIIELINYILKNVDCVKEIVVVDDNSPDMTWNYVEKLAKQNKNVKLLRRTDKRGLASAVLDGVKMAHKDVIVIMDCDFSHPPEIISKMVAALNGYDVVNASRFSKGGGMQSSLVRVLLSRLTNLFANIFLGFSIKDYTGGFFAIKKEVFDKIGISEGYGEYCIELLYKAKEKGFRVKEIPYIYYHRNVGESKTSPNFLTLLKYGIIYCFSILKLKFKPNGL